MKIAFFGTPDFALPSLAMLLKSGHEVSVFTQPDRPVGRKAVLTPPPVKTFAEAHDLPVYQFEKIRAPEGVSALKSVAPDLMVTAAFGQLLSAENLAVPRYGCINVHGSLLPKYRGAAPIQCAVMYGEKKTGVTTMMTDVGMDTGDILLARETPIYPDETAGELSARLSVLGAEVLQETIEKLQNGTLIRTPQDEKHATKCPLLKKENGWLDFSYPAATVHNRVRGTNPWPCAYALLDEKPFKIYRSRLTGIPADPNAIPGTLRGQAKTGLFVQCGDEFLELLLVQAAGGKQVTGKAFLNGASVSGKVLS